MKIPDEDRLAIFERLLIFIKEILICQTKKSESITLEEENIMKEGNKIIEVVPVWKYILKRE